MKIHVYTMVWNEEAILPYFLRHYGGFADRIVAYDNQSSDRTPEILRDHPKVETITLDSGGVLHEAALMALRNQVWKGSRGDADWVVIADADEFLYHEDVRGYLGACRAAGVTMPLTQGYEMVGDAFPAGTGQIYDEVRAGVIDPSGQYSKLAAFDPGAIVETNYSPGGHFAEPTGRVAHGGRRDLKFLHYRHFGPDYLARRWSLLRARLSEFNLRMGFGSHYQAPREEVAERFARYRAEATPVVGPGCSRGPA